MGKASNPPPPHDAKDHDAVADLVGEGPIPFPFPRGPVGGGEEDESSLGDVEVLLSGHLPASPGPWVEQYAAHVAEAGGRRAALVRVGGGAAHIDVFGGALGVDWLGEGVGVEDVVARLRAVRPLWVVQAGDVDLAQLATLPGLGALTLLSGSSEPAVIAAYKVIKSIVIERLDAAEASDDLPDIRVVVMGAERSVGERVVYTLRETAQTFLDERITVGACLERLSPTSGRAVYDGPCALPAAAVLRLLMHGPAPAGRGTPNAVGASRREPATGAVVVDDAAAEPPERRDAGPPGLTDLVEGLTLVRGVRPAFDRQVEVAHDETGRLHVLAYDDSTDRAVRRIVAAGAWARDHAELIGAAAGLSALPSSPVGHVFVGRPNGLAGLLATGLRLHLLTPVEAPSGRLWHTVELS